MKILNPSGEQMAPDGGAVSAEKFDANMDADMGADANTAFNDAVRKSIEAVRESMTPDPSAAVVPDDPLPGVPPSVEVQSNTDDDPLLKSATQSGDGPEFHADDRLGNVQAQLDKVAASILPEHKRAFADSLITGERYTESFNLLGGKLHLVIRSRSSAETEAITAYARRMVVTDKIRTDYDYSALMRKLLAVAQVDEINGAKQPIMEDPLLFTETSEKLEPPAWEHRIKAWGDRPEAILSAVIRCILEFEARYWEMIRKVNDTDFWLPAGPTGE